jgi:catechol 2,3-dioxygenase-like lactoylglutathione lyase family enzyme
LAVVTVVYWLMLSDCPVFPSIRVISIDKSREFYEGKLGLKVVYDKPGELLLLAGKNSRIYLYEGPSSVAENTVAVFYVSNIEEEIDQLVEKGIVFEKYDFGEIKTDERGIVNHAGKKGAWFKDPEGHILGLSQKD